MAKLDRALSQIQVLVLDVVGPRTMIAEEGEAGTLTVVKLWQQHG